ncbi:MAG: protein kinase [Pseudomonadota bacterium]|nr:protein kinase [Pseudomonadota bacterium]
MMRQLDQAVREQSNLPSDANGATVDLKPNTDLPRSLGPDIPISAGHVLRERYVIQEKLGTGGKGSVFRALDRYRSSLPQEQQYVALKILHCGGECSDRAIEDLRREVYCGQLLSHRNIVNVFELDRDADIVFFTMELLDGELLGDLLERMRPKVLQPLQAWQIIRQLGAGLDHAHERGIVHGDLKPRNIFITREGELRILDFGAARKIHRTQSDVGHPDRGQTSGTPAYASLYK